MENPPNSKRTGRWLRTVLVYGLATVLFLLYANFVSSRSEYDTDPVRIEIFNPALASSIGWGVVAVAFGLLILSFISFIRPLVRWPALGLLIGFALYPCAVLSHIANNLAPWTVHGQVILADGTKCVFLDSSFLQDQTMAIAEVAYTSLFTTSYHVLVDNNGDSPRSWASLIRPVDSLDEYGQLYLCNNNYLVGIRYDNRCYLAYDLENKVPYGHGQIESLSPFICLGKNDQVNETDVTRTIDRIQEYADFCATTEDVRHAQSFLDGDSVPGCPPLAAIRDAVETENLSIASAANKLLSCYDDALTRIRTRTVASQEAARNAAEQSGERKRK